MNRRSVIGALGGCSLFGVTGVLATGIGPFGPRESDVTVDVRATDDAPVEFRGTVLDGTVGDDGPARIEFSFRNVSDRTVVYEASDPAPFGVLSAWDEGSDRKGPLLWTDAYEQSDAITVRDGRIVTVLEASRLFVLDPGATVTEQYAIRPDDPGLGTDRYTLRDYDGRLPVRNVGIAPPNETLSLAPGPGERPVVPNDVSYRPTTILTVTATD